VRSAIRLVILFSAALFLTSTFSPSAFAGRSHDRTQMGHNITIAADEEVTDATCFGCSIYVRGHVLGDVTTFGGSVVIEDQGDVHGDATTFAGDIRVEKNVKIGGDITVFGGRLRRDPQASVGGDVTNMSSPGWIFLIFVLPLVVLAAVIALLVWLLRRALRHSVPVTA